jgi:hypothetical protein
MHEITTQADQFGLPERSTPPAPPPERVAEQLRPAPVWESPLRIETQQ